MISFLFEQYGYYPKKIINNCFFFDKWQFKLIETEYSEQEIEEMERYCKFLKSFFKEKGVYIVKNKFQNHISCYEGKNYILISCYKYDMKIDDFRKFQKIFSDQKYRIELINLKEAWKFRMAEIEEKGLGSLKMDSSNYCLNLEKSLFCLGLCQNAIQYLNDIIDEYGGVVKNAIIVHKRVNDLSSFEFFNPFNFVVDSPIRDYVELYRNEYIFLEELVEVFFDFGFDAFDASLFLARLLYPASIFDVIEDIVDNKVCDAKMEYDINKELSKIKKVYLFFREKYNIHPILWLEEQSFI